MRSGHNSKAKPLAFHGKIDKVAKQGDIDELFWINEESGNTAHRPLEQVVEIDADNDPILTAAEKAFAAGDMKTAADGYRRAIAAGSADWVKHRADVRLLSIAGALGDFSGAVTGFVQMATTDPGSALRHRPKIADDAKPAAIDSAISTVNTGLVTATPQTQQVLLPFLMDLYNKKGDSAGASTALAELKKLNPKAAGTGDMTDAGTTAEPSAAATAAKQAEADLAINQASAAMADKQYAQVIKAIDSHSAAFVDPQRQAKALYMLADAKAALASTPAALEDAALAYMRVVAHFKSQPNSPASEALYKTGAIEEKLQKPREALLIYAQVANEYKGTNAAVEAQAAVDRIKAGK